MKGAFALFIIVALLICPSLCNELKLFRLSEKVGDTIDITEREQYSLFPGLANFESARILVKNDTAYFADITCKQEDSTVHLFIKLTSRELERLIFCIENPERIKDQIEKDQYALFAYNRFWEGIESKHVSYTDESDEIEPSQDLGERLWWTIHGMTLGSAIGGFAGSLLGITLTKPGYIEYVTCVGGPSEPMSCPGCVVPIPHAPTYKVNHPVYWTATCIGTGVGAIGGYIKGKKESQNKIPTISEENNLRFYGSVFLSSVVGIAAGAVTFYFLGGTHFGKTELVHNMENDPNNFTDYIPALITSIGVTLEIIHLGYLIGRGELGQD